jgi:serine/threonine protein kinase
MAPESLNKKYFTHKTDVWALGVLLWEIFSDAITPYRGIKLQRLHAVLVSGTRLQRPSNCPKSWYDLMLLPCWAIVDTDRPTFAELVRVMGLLDDESGDATPIRNLGEELEIVLSRNSVATNPALVDGEPVEVDFYANPDDVVGTIVNPFGVEGSISISATNPFASGVEETSFADDGDQGDGNGGGGRIEPGPRKSGSDMPVRREAQLEVSEPPVFAFGEGDGEYLHVGRAGILL